MGTGEFIFEYSECFQWQFNVKFGVLQKFLSGSTSVHKASQTPRCHFFLQKSGARVGELIYI